MNIKREYRRIERTPEQLAELRATRERFQREKPTIDELEAAGGEFLPLADVLQIHELVVALRRERERQNLTLSDMEERTGIAQATLSRLESGRTANPTVATLARVAAALGKGVGYSLTDKA